MRRRRIFGYGPRTENFRVQLWHQSEDRIAAETLAEDDGRSVGTCRLDIRGMKAAGKAEDGAIVLARLQDRRVRRFLAWNGLRADSVVGDDGYLLFSSKSHLIVAAKTGQGLFYGVQTLRQLLQPAGKGLMCPAVGIRDWPSLENLERHPGLDDLSRDFHRIPPARANRCVGRGRRQRFAFHVQGPYISGSGAV